MENQCVGLAEALRLDPVVKRVALTPVWHRLSPWLTPPLPQALAPASDPLTPPWPDLLITCGRRAVGPSLAIRRASRGRTVCVHIQDPRLPWHRFDLLVVPAHDQLTGRRVVTTLGAMHRVTPDRLAREAALFADQVAHLPSPRVAVLIGGSNPVYALSPTVMGDVAEKLADLARGGAGLMVTPSRRTGPDNEAILRARLAGLPAVVWDGTGRNPYFGFLGLADAVIVTADSVSMVSEAATTGRPVYVIPLDGGSPKFERFHSLMRERGITRPFTGVLETWSYTPPDDMARASAAVAAVLARRRPDLTLRPHDP